MQTNIEKYCAQCHKPIKGRTDKKFCDDYCRNIFNNQLKSPAQSIVRNINNALGKNRRILESLIPDGDEMIRTSKDKMLQLGFRFKFNTHVYKNKKGAMYYYCYDYGYLLLENECCLIIKANHE